MATAVWRLQAAQVWLEEHSGSGVVPERHFCIACSSSTSKNEKAKHSSPASMDCILSKQPRDADAYTCLIWSLQDWGHICQALLVLRLCRIVRPASHNAPSQHRTEQYFKH